MKRLRTLRARLTAAAVLAAAVAVALAVVAVNIVLADLLAQDVDRRLRTEAAAVATTVRVHDGRLSVRNSPDDEAIDERVWVFAGQRPIVAARAPAEVARAAAQLAGRDETFAQIGEHGTRLYAHAIVSGGRQVGTVVTAASLGPADRTTDLVELATAILGGVVLAALAFVTWLIVGRALTPVTEMTRAAAQWSEHDPGRRFGTRPRPDELGELAATFDALLDRVAAALRREQRLSAELSHELRTPLAAIVAELELLQRRERSPQDRADAYAVIGRSSAQMQRILETLMAAARAEAAGAPGRSELTATLAELADQWRDPLARRGIALDLQRASAITVGVDADVIERILSPLLDNAGRFARARVALTIARGQTSVTVAVHDDGPGIPRDERASVFEPGFRGAGADGHPGAGLGLALARRLARAAGGDVALGDGGGGATFVVRLPA